MDDLRLGRPQSLLQTQDEEGDGLYLDSRTALHDNVLGARDLPDPRLSRKVEPLVEPAEPERKPFVGFSLSSTAKPVAAGTAAPAPEQKKPDGYVGFSLSSFQAPTQTETQKPKEPESGPLARGAKAGGIDSAKEMAVGGAALVADTVGAKETAGQLYDKYKGMRKESEASAQDYESFSNVMSGKASFGDFLKYWGGYAVGQAAQTVVAAGVGAAAGSVLPGAGTAAGAVEGVVARGAMKSGIQKMIASKMESEVATHMAANAAKGMAAAEAEKLAYEQAARNVMKSVGAATVVSGQNLAMEGASIYGDAKEQANGGEVDLGRVWTGAVLAAATDTVSDLFALKGLNKALGGDGVIRNIAVESFKGGIREGSTEAAQTGFERFGAGKDLATAEALRDYIDSAAAGAVGGVLFGSMKGAFGKKGSDEEGKGLTIEQVRDSLSAKMETDDGRAELFTAFQADPKVAAALKSAGIESADDPRFTSVVSQALRVKEMLKGIEPETPEEIEAKRKQRQADVQAAYGDTASTGIGSNTGANEPVIQRDSVVPNEAEKTLEGEAKPVVLPETRDGQAGTVAMSPEDIVARQQGYEVMPAFQVGDRTVGNRFVSMAQAETFLFGPKNKKTGERAGGYASSVDDMDFQIRQGKRSKAAGGGMFYFIEGRERPKKDNLPSTVVTPPAQPAGGNTTQQAQSVSQPSGKAEPLVDRGDGVMVPQSSIPQLSDVDKAAHEAATSPLNALPAPTPAQIESGNYKKGHVKVHGLNIAVENPAGSERSGTDPSGKAWSQTMQHHYGYVKGTVGKDKDHVDVFIGPNTESTKVFVVDQVNKDGSFDEHKALIGFNTEAEARAAYLSNYEPGWTGLGAISEMPVAAFKSWVKDGTKGKPLALAAQQTEQPVAKAEAQTETKTKAETPKAQTKAEKKRTWGDRARANLAQRDPFRAFLGRYGISLAEASEFAPGPTERRAFMASGYGPIFRRNGLGLDDLAIYAAERGFIPYNQMGTREGYDAVYELIAASVRGKAIFPLHNEDGFEAMEQARQEAMDYAAELDEKNNYLTEDDDGYAQAEREAIQALDEVTDDVLFDLDDVAIEGGSNVDIATAMAALGFTEQEIKDEIARQNKEAQASESTGKAATEETSRASESPAPEARPEQRPEVDPAKLKKLKERINTAYEDGALDLDDVIRLEKMGEDGDLMGAVREMNEIAQLNKGYKAPRYRVKTVGDTGMNKEDVERILAKVAEKWVNMPEIKVVASEDDLPVKQLSRIKKADMSGKVPGMYLNGKVWLIAGNIHDAKDAVLTIAHEITGHYGLRSILGEGHAAKMRELYNGNKAVKKLADEMMVKEGLSVEEATEEVLADMAESGKDLEPEAKSALRQIYAAIRKWLREMFNIKFVSDAEVKAIVGNARKFVIEGEGEQGKGGTKAADESMKSRTVLKGGTPTFYSALERGTRGAKQEKATAKDWKAIIAKLPGVKKEEVKWTGVEEWLDLEAQQKRQITKQEVLDFIGGNRVRLNDLVLTAGKYALDDAELYELVEQMGEDPDTMSREDMVDAVASFYGWKRKAVGEAKHRKYTLDGGDDATYTELILVDPKAAPYKAQDKTHFGTDSEGKAIGWLRMIVRKDTAGNDVLFLEELQSQRGQDGRDKMFFKGDKDEAIDALTDRIETARMAYINSKDGSEENTRALAELKVLREKRDALRDSIPAAPFVDDTQAWTGLLIKRAIAYAQGLGIDRIAWTHGDQQADRYKLSKNIDSISYMGRADGTFDIVAEKNGKEVLHKQQLTKAELDATVGKGMADQIAAEGVGEIKGLDLDIGGDGVRNYYNKIVPSVAKGIVGKNAVEVMSIEGTGQQLGFVIPEALQKQVEEDGLPMFRRKDYESQFSDVSEKVRNMALAKGFYSPPTIRERIESLKPNFWLRVVQGTFDRFRSVRDIDLKAYMKLRMSAGPQDGALSVLLHYGQVFNDDGALNIKKGTKGLIEVLGNVGMETDRFLMWIAANRAGELKKQDREHFFTDEEVRELKQLNLGTMKDGKSRAAVYAKTLQEMNELNRSVLDVARQSGLIDEAAYKRFSQDVWYVPFYRNMEQDGSLSGVQTSTAAVGQYLSKKLKGSERQLNDLLENVLMNWSHILSASMKNGAAVETLQAASKMGGIVTRLPTAEKGSVKVMEGGKETHYRIDDEFLLASLDAVANMQSYGMFTNLAREFKTTLTRMVSLSPTFKINNLVRDSVQSIALADLKRNPVANAIEGYKAYKTDRASALAGGGLFAMGNAFDGDAAYNVKHLIRKGVPNKDILNTEQKVGEFFKGIWDKYDEVSDAMENSNRIALYNQLRANGATHLEAAYAARDLQDFSLQGGFTAVRYLSQVLPYFNARLQGMYKLGRDGFDPVVQVLTGEANASDRQKAARFGTVLTAVTLFGVMLYLSQKDDDDYKALEDWERDSFFWFKIPGTKHAIRIPKPFELGAVETIIERITEQMVDDGVEGKLFGKRLLAVLHDNLAINPIPQVVRPLYDIARNKDGFTDRAIESMGMERLSKENRINQSTSTLAIGLNRINGLFADVASAVTGGALKADSLQLSPIQYDYLVRGYLGWLGGVAETASNVASAPIKPGESSRFERIDDYLVVGNFVKTLPQSQSRYVTSFYETAADVAMAASDYQNFMNLGQFKRAEALYEEKGDLLAMKKMYAKGTDTLSKLTKQAKMIEDDPDMSGAEKRLELERVNKLKSDYAKEIEDARISMQRQKGR